MEKIYKPITIERRKPRILFDQDDVLFDFMGELIRRHNKHTGENRLVEECLTWDIEKYYGREIMDIIKAPGFFRDLPPKAKSLETFERMYLSGDYDIRIVTSVMSHGYSGKIESILKNMPYFDLKHFIACSDKGSVWGDYLIDDGLHNQKSFEGIGTGILFDMPHNRLCNDYVRVSTLEEAEKFIKMDWEARLCA